MNRYLRPLGILSGAAARRAVDKRMALPLAGGPLAFSLVEVVERGDGIRREIVPAADIAAELAGHTAARARYRDAPVVMGIVNVTPDSFSDGGAYHDADRAIAHGLALVGAGAGIVDVGGESTRPGAAPVDPTAEAARVVPVIRGLAAAGVTVSIDSRNARTLYAALEAGAAMINDVSALTHDPESIAVAADSDVPVVLMHMLGDPATMQRDPAYDDVALDVYDYLAARIAAAEAGGIDRSRILLDPGIGFGKTVAHNLTLLDQLALFHGLGVPLLVGVSRKGFIGRLSAGEPADRRLGGSLAAGLAAMGQGAQILRVHDVPETMQAVRMVRALRDSAT
ncbi:MAG TPA: dihydropteroate synthase [Alphaproteobacteria bacterium]|nr:dihydropteroate synthase [Alphaproteobacteria bacterium]